MRTNRKAHAALALALVAATSCDDAPTTPAPANADVPGIVEVTLLSPHRNDDRAALFRIAPPDTTLTASFVDAAEGVVAHHRVDESGILRVALFGPVETGGTFRVRLSDIRRAEPFAFELEAVAGPGGILRTDLPSYVVREVVDSTSFELE